MSDLWSADEQLVGRWDLETGRYVVTGWTYGPAGPARAALTPRLTLSLDYANPHLTNEVLIDAPEGPLDMDPRTEASARAVLGSAAYERLLRLAGSDIPGGP